MRIISSTLGAISNIFDSINAVAQLASDTAEQGLNSLRREAETNKQLEDESLSKRVEVKRLEIDREFERIERERSKLEESEFFRKSQARKITSMIEIEEFRQAKELSSTEKIALLKDKLEKLQDAPAKNVADVKTANK